MKKNTRTLSMMAFLSIALLFATTTSGAEPGTASDPVVTKSYVDQQITELKQLLKGQQGSIGSGATPAEIGGDLDWDQLMLVVDFLLDEKLSDSSGAVSNNLFTPVLVPAGTLLYPTQDGLEVILRSGEATVVSGVNGITDLTTGTDIINGQEIPRDHMLIIPRTDRGISVTKDTWFLLKGPYIINNAN